MRHLLPRNGMMIAVQAIMMLDVVAMRVYWAGRETELLEKLGV